EQLRRHWADRGLRPLALVEEPTPLVAAVLGDHGRGTPAAHAALGEIHWAQVRMLAPDDYARAARRAGRKPVAGLPAHDVAEVYRRYQHLKDRRGVLDLDDLVTRCAALLEEDATAAAAVRWRTRHLFVDEFQDVNPAQWRLLSAWLGEGRDLCVVGDPRQAIYAWNGADPSLLDTLPALVPGISVVRLDDNHRCTPQVLSTAAAVLAGPGARATRPDGPAPVIAGFDDDGAEARALARWLRCAHRPGRSWSQLAVLARTHARLEPVAAALAGAGIPVRVAGGRRDAELRAALRALRRMPAQRRLRSALAELVAGDGCGERPPAVDALERLADEHALEAPGASVGEFVEWAVAEGVLDHEAGAGDAVELCTFHRAKGLEWPAVAVVGLEAGMVPIVHASAPEALAEEHRLLYVALTRAEDELWCSWSGVRSSGDKTWRCEPSPLVDRLSRGAREAAPRGQDLPGRLAALRATLSGGAPCAPGLPAAG
ncbi:MAG TPA: ATP-dependent helicase, partial [Acidimicrobiales bacterium]|nr:ATP-dependent helicase [Acidimicrobiales bacterium]